MELTKRQLQNLIQEELQNVLQEAPWGNPQFRLDYVPGARPIGRRRRGGGGRRRGPVAKYNPFADPGSFGTGARIMRSPEGALAQRLQAEPPPVWSGEMFGLGTSPLAPKTPEKPPVGESTFDEGDGMFGDNREGQWRLIDQLVGETQHSDLERAEALRDLADELEDRHHDEGAELGFYEE
jgi:hypothetical protein